jgi:hypothetical protein
LERIGTHPKERVLELSEAKSCHAQ